jgi:hypothetical protein
MAYTETFEFRAIPVRSWKYSYCSFVWKELKANNPNGIRFNSDAIHSPNYFGIFNYLKGIETIPLFYKYFVELSK